MDWERKRDVIAERDRLRVEIARKEEKIAELLEKLNKDKHRTGTQCIGCKNLLSGKTFWNGYEIEEKMCKLDITCKDRKESNL